MRKVFKKVLIHGIAVVIGFAFAIVVTVYAEMYISSSQVAYTGNNQESVDGALDDLYTRALLYNNPESVDTSTLTSNTKKSIYASSKGVCLARNNKFNCFKTNNYNKEKAHIQKVFEGAECRIESDYVFCTESGVNSCRVRSNGDVDCHDTNDPSSSDNTSYCYAYSNGGVECYPEVINKDDWIDPSYMNFGTLTTNSAKNILASSSGVCIRRNYKTSCFKINNFTEEKDHIQQVFSDISCFVSSANANCSGSDFYCNVSSNGNVYCNDPSVSSGCNVYRDGSVDCT